MKKQAINRSNLGNYLPRSKKLLKRNLSFWESPDLKPSLHLQYLTSAFPSELIPPMKGMVLLSGSVTTLLQGITFKPFPSSQNSGTKKQSSGRLAWAQKTSAL
ncbi:hypothetical protein [Enterovibrio norvegicus]|uniref:hypothetical protein n=1 Tax=Enterovibrio norvegicus TaxID=188144 RepID=UPI00035EC020|nr:hypothetical protein [Enterovibrio norvegicus]OEF57950.1 hypothetical protein A1OU_07015 [Enterovibrio norvegicus]